MEQFCLPAAAPPVPLVPQEFVLLQLTRDRLSEVVAPVTGPTVAYTSMLTEALLFFKATFDLAEHARVFPTKSER